MQLAAEKYTSFPIASITKADGDVTVLGRCSDGGLDSDGDIVSPAFMAQAIKTWLRVLPAVYRDHSTAHPAGMGVDAWQDDSGATWVKSRISDTDSKALLLSGRLTSYSVGLHDVVTQKSARCPRYEIVSGRLTEISIVGTPANSRCGVRVIGKSGSGVPQFIGKAFGMAGKPGKAEKSLRKAAKLLGVEVSDLDAAGLGAPVVVEKAFRRELAAWTANSSDPFIREAARSRGFHL